MPPPSAPSTVKADWRAMLPPTLRAALSRKRKPKLQELATFTQQLANLLQSGMPLTVALNSMTHLESKGISADVSRELKQDVMEGRSLSDSMAKQPRIFSDLYVNMVRAGESSGALVEVLRRMADHFERFAQVQAKFTSALIYPAFVAVVGVSHHVFFHDLHAAEVHDHLSGHERSAAVCHSDPGQDQPYLCRLLVADDADRHLCSFALFKRFQSSKEGRRKLDQWKMSTPLFGKVIKLNLFGQFARTLSTLLENGVPVLTALKITEQIIPNVMVKEAIAKTREEVTDGKTIAQPLARSKIFPQLMVDLRENRRGDRRCSRRVEEHRRHLRERTQHRLARADEYDRAGHDHRHGLRRRFSAAERAFGDVCDYVEYRHAMRQNPKSTVQGPKSERGFTLIEIMVVVAIMAIVMLMSIPFIRSGMRKESLAEAMRELEEVCASARRKAILQGSMAEIIFRPKERTFQVAGGSANSGTGEAVSADATTAPAAHSGESGHIPDDLMVDMLDVNLADTKIPKKRECALSKWHRRRTDGNRPLRPRRIFQNGSRSHDRTSNLGKRPFEIQMKTRAQGVPRVKCTLNNGDGATLPYCEQKHLLAFTLLEVMIACGIFFIAVFAILGLVSNCLRNARALRHIEVDAGMVAAQLSKTNRLTEGALSGDFGDNYHDYTWETMTQEAATNGLYQVDIVVRKHGFQNPVDTMSVWIYSPESATGPLNRSPFNNPRR